MFNIEKIILFVVTIITSAAFLFFIPLIHIQIDWASLVTHHRIKVGLTLLSPVIFGAITAYIAYQQHLLSRTQANISKDQRDIAHDKLRIENYEKLYEIYNSFLKLYRNVFIFERFYPSEFQNELEYRRFHHVSDLVDQEIPQKIKDWAESYLDKEKELNKLLGECWDNQLRCEFMLDEKAHREILEFYNYAKSLFDTKKACLEKQLHYSEASDFIKIVMKEREKLNNSISNVTKKMKPYMDISDIMTTRKLDK